MAYDRLRDLPRLVALWPDELSDFSIEGRKMLIAKLRATLQRERQRSLDGHWCYDLNRHRALLGCYRSECKQLASMLDDERARVWIGQAHLGGVA